VTWLRDFVRERRGLALGLVSALFLATYIIRHLFISITPSISYRVLWLDDVHNARKGDYVVFRLDTRRLQGVPLPVDLRDEKGFIRAVKRLACDEGEVISHRGPGGRDIYCGDEFLGRVKERSHTGQPLRALRFEGVIPPGRAYMAADNMDSFDSRYFGLVDKRDFEYRAIGFF